MVYTTGINMFRSPVKATLLMTLIMPLTVSLGITNEQAEKVNYIMGAARLQTWEDRLVRLENTLSLRQKRSDDNEPWEAVTAGQAQELSSLKAQLQAAQNKITALESTQGSTFVRWGRSQCPSNSEIVYTGIAGGSKYSEQGGGANRLCLTHSPQFDQATPLSGYHTNIHGTEWFIPGHDHPEVPCVVCRVPHPTTVMVPGTKACPQGWTSQYSGHIMAADTRYTASSEFLCVDGNPEDREGTGSTLNDGGLFMYSVAACGSLPCPPYIDGKVVTCIVCSK